MKPSEDTTALSEQGTLDVEIRSELRRAIRDIRANKTVSAIKRLETCLAVLPGSIDMWLTASGTQQLEADVQLLEFARLDYDSITSRFAGDLLDALRRASVDSAPFPHLRLSTCFDPQRYEFLSRSFPSMDFLQPRRQPAYLKDGVFQRYETALTDNGLKGAGHTCRKVWLSLARALSSPEFVHAMSSALAVSVPPRWEVRARVMVDRCGFAIEPHTDGGNGALWTLQAYLPDDDALANHGTEFYRRTIFGAFKTAAKMRFLPNHGHAFATSTVSWHGLRVPIPLLAERRRNLVVRLFEAREEPGKAI